MRFRGFHFTTAGSMAVVALLVALVAHWIVPHSGQNAGPDSQAGVQPGGVRDVQGNPTL